MPNLLKIREVLVRDTHPELPLDPDVAQPGVYKWPPHFTPAFLLAVFLGGCFGTAARYWISLELPTTTNGIPAATLFVNLLGAFLLGMLLEGLVRLGSDKGARRAVRLAVGTGFMGAFTTYSTFAVEATLLMRNNHIKIAVIYISIMVFGGIIMGAFGVQIAAFHHGRREAKQ